MHADGGGCAVCVCVCAGGGCAVCVCATLQRACGLVLGSSMLVVMVVVESQCVCMRAGARTVVVTSQHVCMRACQWVVVVTL